MRLRNKLAAIAVVAALTALLAGCDNDFLQAGFNSSNTKFNPETSVTAANVGTLHKLWTANVQGGKSSRSAPTVATIDNVKYVFVSTSNGFLEKRRADTGAAVWAVPDGNAGSGDTGSSTSSPAVVTPKTGFATTQVVIGSMDGHVYSFDARTGAAIWQYPTTFNDLVPVTSSPTITPVGNVLITTGERFSDNFLCATTCLANVLWTVLRVDPATGTTNGGWGLGSASMAVDTSGNLTNVSALSGASSPAYDPASGMVYIGEPNVLWDQTSWPPDLTSGVIALHAPDNGGFSFAWEQRWDNNFAGVSAAPAVAGGHVFVSTLGGLRAFAASSGAVQGTAAGAASQYSSPAVAANTVFVGTDNGYTKAFDVNGLAVRWTSGQAVDGSGNPVSTASPVVVGENDNKGVVPYVVFNTNGNGDVKAFNAVGSGTIGALATVNDHGTGKGGVAVSGGVVFVQGGDGQLRAFGR